MRYAKIIEGAVVQYPITGTDIIFQYPNTSFPSGPLSEETMAQYDCLPVTEVALPAYDQKTQVMSEGPCVYNAASGQWQTSFVVRSKTAEELQADNNAKSQQVRSERNTKLAECDWTQLPDAPVSAQPWANYRQQLRDVTSQAGFPWDVQWPEAPAA